MYTTLPSVNALLKLCGSCNLLSQAFNQQVNPKIILKREKFGPRWASSNKEYNCMLKNASCVASSRKNLHMYMSRQVETYNTPL